MYFSGASEFFKISEYLMKRDIIITVESYAFGFNRTKSENQISREILRTLYI